jgi:hypothetical protein
MKNMFMHKRQNKYINVKKNLKYIEKFSKFGFRASRGKKLRHRLFCDVILFISNFKILYFFV